MMNFTYSVKKSSEEIKETIRRISALIPKEIYNEECIVEEFGEAQWRIGLYGSTQKNNSTYCLIKLSVV